MGYVSSARESTIRTTRASGPSNSLSDDEPYQNTWPGDG